VRRRTIGEPASCRGFRGEKHEACRPRTAAELEALPVHMRTAEVCSGKLVAYELIVRVDDERPDTTVFRPAGAKGDRPIFVLHERRLEQGSHRVRISFAPISTTIKPSDTLH
jgi:hypothetical protein